MSPRDDAELTRWEALIDREAIGESLAAEEREFVVAYEAAHPELARERELFEAAIGLLRERLDAEDDELTEARHAALALERYRSERDQPRHVGGKTRRSLWIAAVAVAAGLALGVGIRQLGDDDEPKLGAGEAPVEQTQAPERAQPEPIDPRPSDVTPVEPIGRLSMVESGAPIEFDAALELGASVSAERACVSWSAPTAVVCFEGELRSVAGSDVGERRLRLESGRLVAALDPLGPGRRFTIETAAGSVSAIGTVFTVELDGDRAWVTVHEGRVELRDPAVRMLTAGRRTSLPGGEPLPIEAAANEPLVELAELLRASPDAGMIAPDTQQPEAEPASDDASKPPTAKQLAAAAQRERAAKNYDETARLYRELLRRYPDSPEAANVPVRLGDLLASTGDHSGALEAYELYLERGAKPLAREAEYGRIQALQALGRKTEERAAIEAFLAARPDDYRNTELRARLAEL